MVDEVETPEAVVSAPSLPPQEDEQQDQRHNIIQQEGHDISTVSGVCAPEPAGKTALADAPALLAALRAVLSAFQHEAEKASGDHFGEGDAKQLKAALGGIEAVLEFSSGVSCLGNADRVDWATVADALEGAGGLDSLDGLQEHEDPTVCKLSGEIYDRYFDLDESEDVEGTGGGSGAEHKPVVAVTAAVEALAVALERAGVDTTNTFGDPARDAATIARRSLNPRTKSATKQ
jgi:Atypical Arm repeat